MENFTIKSGQISSEVVQVAQGFTMSLAEALEVYFKIPKQESLVVIEKTLEQHLTVVEYSMAKGTPRLGDMGAEWGGFTRHAAQKLMGNVSNCPDYFIQYGGQSLENPEEFMRWARIIIFRP